MNIFWVDKIKVIHQQHKNTKRDVTLTTMVIELVLLTWIINKHEENDVMVEYFPEV